MISPMIINEYKHRLIAKNIEVDPIDVEFIITLLDNGGTSIKMVNREKRFTIDSVTIHALEG